MKPVLARIISAAPPQAQNHIQTYQLQTIPSSKYKTGDWVYLDQIPGSNNYRINGMAQPTQSQFPSFEWKRLHQQLDNGLNRIEILKLRSRILSHKGTSGSGNSSAGSFTGGGNSPQGHKN
jgi:hypothetical protein